MKSLNKFIYQAEPSDFPCDFKSLKKNLYDSITYSPLRRSRILFHESLTAEQQRMLIAFDSTSTVPLVTHTFNESFICVDGAGRYIVMNDANNKRVDYIISDYKSDQLFYCAIKKTLRHRFTPLTSRILAFEIAHAAFDKENTKISDESSHIQDLSNDELAVLPINRPSDFSFKRISNDAYSIAHLDVPHLSRLHIADLFSSSFPVVVEALKESSHESTLLEMFLLMVENQTYEIKNKSLFVISGSVQLDTGSEKEVILKTGQIYMTSQEPINIIAKSMEGVIHVS